MPTVRLEPKTKVWLKFNGVKFILPVNPPELEITASAPADRFMILGIGQIEIPQLSNLRRIKFDSFFPGNTNDPYTNAEAEKPKYYNDILMNALNQATVGRLIVKRPNKNNLNIRVTIATYTATDTGGEPQDLPYSIELLEYRSYKPEKVVIKTKNNTPTTASQAVQRAVDNPVMRVGATVIANGPYYYDSYGSEPHGTAKNLRITVKRIVPGRPYPILIGTHGWIKESNLQVKG